MASLLTVLFVVFCGGVFVVTSPTKFVEVSRIQNYFFHEGNHSKCRNEKYNELFKPVVSSEVDEARKTANKRMHGYIFSQVMLIGVVKSVAKEDNDTSGNTYDVIVSVECYLRGDMALSEIKVLQLGPSKVDDRCFILPVVDIKPQDRVLVYGNTAFDRHSLRPLEGGIQKLLTNEKPLDVHFKSLWCIPSLNIVIPKLSSVPLSPFCQKVKLEPTDCEDSLSIEDVEDDLTNKWTILKQSLQDKSMDISSLKLEPYFSSDYGVLVNPSSLNNIDGEDCEGVYCHSSRTALVSVMLLACSALSYFINFF